MKFKFVYILVIWCDITSFEVTISDILLSGLVQKWPKDDERNSEYIYLESVLFLIHLYFDVLFSSYGHTVILYLTQYFEVGQTVPYLL
jgi:hypothetical protein